MGSVILSILRIILNLFSLPWNSAEEKLVRKQGNETVFAEVEMIKEN